jgi:GAF domain-containing protein
MLVQEVANQLGLALENAELYQTAQQELAERTRAEQEIRERNQDLATLNQAGQQLSRLTTVGEILELVSSMIGQLLGNRNLSIVLYDQKTRKVSYPVVYSDGERQNLEPQDLPNDLTGYLYWTRQPVLIEHNAESDLVEKGISLPERIPHSVLAIPLVAGERIIGAIVLQDYEHEAA